MPIFCGKCPAKLPAIHRAAQAISVIKEIDLFFRTLLSERAGRSASSPVRGFLDLPAAALRSSTHSSRSKPSSSATNPVRREALIAALYRCAEHELVRDCLVPFPRLK